MKNKSAAEVKLLLKRMGKIGIQTLSPEEIKKIILTKYDDSYLTREFLKKSKAN